jgi:alpha-mannosidase
MEENYPEIFQRIKKRVEEGRWEIVGGMWVEPDCNLPSGESFVRQFLYGKRYFKEKFNVDVKTAFMIDTFGFTWTLPQIMRKCGVKYFTTQKLNWNDTTLFPHSVFHWRSPDGSSVLAHQTVGSYNESVIKKEVISQLAMLNRKHDINKLLVLFGKGDHGGGITPEMINNAKEIIQEDQGINGKFSTVKDYFTTLEKIVDEKEFPEVDDELYLQSCRGTYTTQAQAKKNNRKTEVLLETAEKVSTIALQYGFRYPKKELDEAWKTLLLNQFHDILPGSSIQKVYEDSEEDFKKINKSTNSVISNAVDAISSHINTVGEGYSVIIFNQLSWKRDGKVEVPLNSVGDLKTFGVQDDDGEPVPFQIVESDGVKKILFIAEEVPSLGYREYRIHEMHPSEKPRTEPGLSLSQTAAAIELENEFYRVLVDKQTGRVRSVFDKRDGWDVLAREGSGITVFPDVPTEGRVSILLPYFDASLWDAWNVYIYQQPEDVKPTELDEPLKVEVVEEGDVRLKVRVQYRYKQEGRPDSTFVQEVMLYRHSPLIEFGLHVDWRTKHVLAKLRFTLSMENDFTTYEIPYGFMNRRSPYSPNSTLVERAKWEVSGHKWIDKTSSDGEHGVSLFNDSKYGFDNHTDLIGVTLLRSPEHPNLQWRGGTADVWDAIAQVRGTPPTDQGFHEATCALYPHRNGWREAMSPRKACEFNYPFIVKVEPNHDGDLPKKHSFIQVKGDNAILTVVKKPETGEGIILRLYETNGEDGEVEIKFNNEITSAFETDMLERKISGVVTSEKVITTSLAKNEIKTLLVKSTPKPEVRKDD